MQQRVMMRIFIFILLSIPYTLNAKIHIEEEFEFYSVIPLSVDDLISSVKKASPIRANKNIYFGSTKYNINWQFWWKRSSKQCRISKVKTTLKLKYTMPKLESDIKEVQVVWNSWYPNLRKHEKRHGQLAKKMTSKIDSSIYNMKPRSNCDLLSKEANELGYKLLDKLKQENAEYDKKTNYGDTEKAWIYSHL